MEAQIVERGSRLTPARLVLGSLIGGAGIAILGFFWSASPASATEPVPQPAPVGHSLVGAAGSAVSDVGQAVTDAVGRVSETAAAVSTPVVQAVPAPVQQAVADVVAPVATPVTTAVQGVAESSPAAHVVAPVAAAHDGVVNAVPMARGLLGDSPISTVTAPVSDLLDTTVHAVVDPATDAIDPVLGTPAAPGLGVQLPGSLALGDSVIGYFVAAPASATQFSARPADGMSLALITDGALGARPGVGSPVSTPGAPPIPGGQTPSDQLAVTSGTASSAGSGAAGAAAATTEKGFNFSAADLGAHARAADDVVPSSPVADHDISPD
jgi:hypothetical protein